MAECITRNFLPVKVHIKEQPAVFDRFQAVWTPTVVVLDAEGTERHRFEGFLPAQDFLSQIELGLAHAAFGRKQWEEAQTRYRQIVDRFASHDAGPEALYWAGVAKYKRAGDAAALVEVAEQLEQKYPDSVWARKSSVWRQ
ncbi:MAG: tetratricopeptide repeat protein [Acidobacteria bacterium]|nr:tetratricopeptide repeat protein [Acidobacteriota bacterium]